jgi:protein phosphatase
VRPDRYELLDALDSAVNAIRLQQPQWFNVKGKLVTLPADGELIVVGDLHGDMDSLEHILAETGFEERVMEGEPLYIIFLGDYVDRGPRQVEVLYRLLRLLGSYPHRVVLLRGNHEGPRDVTFQPHDFPLVLREKYGSDALEAYREFRDLCDELYTAAVIPGSTLFVHGGVPTAASCLDDLAYAHVEHPAKSSLVEALWNDPMEDEGVYPNPRGLGLLFGPDVAERVLGRMGVSTLVRSHQSCTEGYMWTGVTLTLFSCKLPNNYGNRYAAYLRMPMGGDLVSDYKEYITRF